MKIANIKRMSTFRKARSLSEVSAQTIVEALEPGDPRYVDLSVGRATTELRKMQLHLEDQDAEDNRFAKVAFVGHRGCGKSTELLRLEHDLASRFTPIHLYADPDLAADFDYTDLLLWLAETLAQEFGKNPKLRPLDKGLIDLVGQWFAERTVDRVETLRSEIQAEVKAEAGAKVGFFSIGLRMLARLKGMVKGDMERRHEIRQRLRRYSSELINKVNLLLDNAAQTLKVLGRRPDLLVVQDNLDRLTGETARKLFFESGDLLKQLRAHMVFTVPIAMVLSPWSIGNVFENSFFMPTLKPRNRDGKEVRKTVDALVSVLAARLDMDRLFSGRSVAKHLARACGGSIRDLIRLLNYAQLSARTRGGNTIDTRAAKEAVTTLRLDYEKLLVPGQVYYPVLARIHGSKDVEVLSGPITPEAAESSRAFLRDLLFNGSVIEYNGDECWYDVHPVITEIRGFKDALKKVPRTQAVRQGSSKRRARRGA